MRKNQNLLFILIAIMALGLSACGAKDSNNKGDEEKVLTIETEQKNDSKALQFEESKMLVENDGLEIQNLSPYSGNDFQEGQITEVSDVYAIKVTNLTSDMIREASLIFNDGNQELEFIISFLPAGESTIIVEAEQKKGAASNLIYVEGDIEYLPDAENAINSVSVVFEEDRSVRVNNNTEEDISLLWLVCKPFNDQDETYGTSYIIVVDTLEAEGEQYIETELSDGDYQIVWAQRIE